MNKGEDPERGPVARERAGPFRPTAEDGTGKGQGGEKMKAFVLIKVETGKVQEVLRAISAMPQVKEAYCVTGPDDIIAVLESDDAKSISEVVIAGLHGVQGIKGTDTRMVVEVS